MVTRLFTPERRLAHLQHVVVVDVFVGTSGLLGRLLVHVQLGTDVLVPGPDHSRQLSSSAHCPSGELLSVKYLAQFLSSGHKKLRMQQASKLLPVDLSVRLLGYPTSVNNCGASWGTLELNRLFHWLGVRSLKLHANPRTEKYSPAYKLIYRVFLIPGGFLKQRQTLLGHSPHWQTVPFPQRGFSSRH